MNQGENKKVHKEIEFILEIMGRFYNMNDLSMVDYL